MTEANNLLTDNLGPVLDCVDEIKDYALRYQYNQFYIAKVNAHKIEVDRGVLLRLIELDIEMTGNIDEVMALSMKQMENLIKFLKQKQMAE